MKPFPTNGSVKHPLDVYADSILSRAIDFLDRFGASIVDPAADAWEQRSAYVFAFESKGAGIIVVTIDVDGDDEGRERVSIMSVTFERGRR